MVGQAQMNGGWSMVRCRARFWQTTACKCCNHSKGQSQRRYMTVTLKLLPPWHSSPGAGGSALVRGFYKRGCQEKTPLPWQGRGASLASSPLRFSAIVFRRSVVGIHRSSRFHFIHSAFIPRRLRLTSSVMSTMVLSETRGLWLCWVVRGSIRWRVRLVAYPTQWILALEPERSATGGPHEPKSRRPMTLRAQAACVFRCSASNASPFFQIVSVIAAILRASVSRAIAGNIPLSRSPW